MFDHLPRLSEPMPMKRKPPRTREEDEARERRRQIAEETLRDVNNGHYYTNEGTKYGFEDTQIYGQTNTIWVAPDDAEIQQWPKPARPINFPFDPPVPATVSIVLSPTVKTIHHLHAKGCRHVGILNFANPIQPGGGFVSGAEAQEESLARSSNLHAMLTSNEGTEFYVHHMNSETDGFNTHAMIYAPVVIFMRDENGRVCPPSQVAVITCAAVNRVEVRRNFEHSRALVREMEDQMRERMGRILRLFEECGDRHLILGSFGTGVFQNPVRLIATVWADLLVGEGARFQKSFESVVFAIKDADTFDEFKQAFAKKVATVDVEQS